MASSAGSRPANRVEAKYNVTTEYPDLGLHSAAITGNVGLAHYALTHGQPENSVLHGLLPLHAASSGGSEQIVAMLIERGADVNAPRLPRRYSNEGRNVPSVGVSGSGPLHFAAAAGHVGVTRLLLAKGAIPDKRDKHGLTPEDLALANEHYEVVALLRAWSTLRLSLQERLLGDESAIDDDETGEDSDARAIPPLRSTSISSTPGAGNKASAMMRGLGNFANRGRRSSSSAAQRPASSIASSALGRSSSLNRKPTKGCMSGELSSLRTASKLSLSSERSDSALSLSSPLDGAASSSGSAPRRLATDAPPTPLPVHLTQSRHRRPSLPSIIEKAAHQMAHPRSRHASNQDSLPGSTSRTHSFTSSSDAQSIDARSIASSTRFTSSRSLLKIFSRHRNGLDSGGASAADLSPESASPSPPRSSSALQLDDEDIGRTIEEFRRLSVEIGSSAASMRSSLDGSTGGRAYHPPSAPASRTEFFPSQPRLDPRGETMQRSMSQRSEPGPDASEYSGRPGGSLWSIGARGAGGDRSPLVHDWSPGGSTADDERRRRRASEGRADDWASGGLKRKARAPARACSYGEDGRYLSSTSVDNGGRGSVSPDSPGGSSPQAGSARGQWLSNSSSPYYTETDEPSAGASTHRPVSQQSSNLSSLRRVASANLRRSAEDPYSPTSSYGDLGYNGPPQMSQIYPSMADDRESTAGWNLRGIDPRRGPGFAGGLSVGLGRPGGGRARGASINSTLSSAFSVSPQLDTHLSEGEEGPSSPAQVPPPAIFVSATSPPAQGRARAFSGSSLVSNASRGPSTGGSGGSGSSYTSPSFLSSGAPSTSSGPTVPSVPEDHSAPLGQVLSFGGPSTSEAGLKLHPGLQPRVSSYAEAHDLVRQAEKDLLDLPAKRSSVGASGSTLSLAAQLAAYGERLAIEREFARASEVDLNAKGPMLEAEPPNASIAAVQEQERQAAVSPRRKSTGGSTITLPASDSPPPATAKDRPRADSIDTATAPAKSRGLRMGNLMGFQRHSQERASVRSISGSTPLAPTPPPLNLGPIPQAPSAGAHHLTELPEVARVYQNRADALRKRGQKVASALGSPLTSPVSPSVRRGTKPPRSVVEAEAGKMWIISGQPSTVTRTPPTPESTIFSSSAAPRLPPLFGASDDTRSLRTTGSKSTNRKHSLDAHLSPNGPLASHPTKRPARLVPPSNLVASPLRSSSPISAARALPSNVASAGPSRRSSRGSPDTISPRRSRDHSPATSVSGGSSSRFEVVRRSSGPDTAPSPSTSSPKDGSPQPHGLGLGPIGGSSPTAFGLRSARDDSTLEEYGSKRKSSAPSWGSRFLHGIGRKG